MNCPSILYVEDDENDAFLMRRAFKKAEIAASLEILDDGQKAVDFLAALSAKDRKTNPLPCLILLDMKLPKKTGLEVLKWIRTTPAIAKIPVVMFTSSNQNDDISRAYLHGANDYLIKPGDPRELALMVEALRNCWITGTRSSTSNFASTGLPAPKPDQQKPRDR